MTASFDDLVIHYTVCSLLRRPSLILGMMKGATLVGCEIKVKNGGGKQDDRNFDGAMREDNKEFKTTTATATGTSLN